MNPETMTRKLVSSALALAAVIAIGLAPQAASAQQIYGSQLMTEQERIEHRARLRNATNEQERARIREEHHNRMRERARTQGVTLPEDPPAQGMGRGKGMGSGMGMGRGSGGGGGGGRR